MAVNFPKITSDQLHPISGIKLGYAKAGIRQRDRKDVLVMTIDDGAVVAGVFTKNYFCAAPVLVCREHLLQVSIKPIRAIVVNTGYANAGTGKKGLDNAYLTCKEMAVHLNVLPQQVLPFSTGIILEHLPMDRLIYGLNIANKRLSPTQWYSAAQAIMTTDTLPKAASRQLCINGEVVTITGISKGAGMIRPNMATMLSFVATDARIAQPVLDILISEVVNQSFNCISVDGDMSTNDSFIIIATGKANLACIEKAEGVLYAAVRDALIEISRELAKLIIRDAEGATKFITLLVEGGRDVFECKKIAYAIAHSPLIKTAFYASDPNLGRILAAIGYADIDELDTQKINLYLGGELVFERGRRKPNYCEKVLQGIMKETEITVKVTLGRGTSSITIWTCDLSHEYVSINGKYRS